MCSAGTTNATDSSIPASVPALLDQGHEQAAAGKYDEARDFFQQAVSQLHQQREDTDHLKSIQGYELAVALANLGHCCAKLGLLEEAAIHWQESLRLKRCYYNYEATAAGGAEQRCTNLDLALALENVAMALKEMGDYSGAKRHYHEALDIKRLVYGKEHAGSSTSASPNDHRNDATRSMSASQMNRRNDATTFPLRASTAIRQLGIKQQVYGYDRAQNTDVAYTLVRLGEVAQCLGHFHKARNRYAEALDMFRTAHGTNNKSATTADTNNDVVHIDIAKVLARLGHVNADIGKRRLAALYFDHSISMVKELVEKGETQHAGTLATIQEQRDTCLARFATTVDQLADQQGEEGEAHHVAGSLSSNMQDRPASGLGQIRQPQQQSKGSEPSSSETTSVTEEKPSRLNAKTSSPSTRVTRANAA